MKTGEPIDEADKGRYELEELAGALLTGGLSDDERAAIARRLAEGDVALEAEIAQVRESLAMLAIASDPLLPPPHLKAQLIASLSEVQSEGISPLPAPGGSDAPLLHSVQDNIAEPLAASMDADADWQAVRHMLSMMNDRTPPESQPPPSARRALLVIDMLHDYVDEGAPMETPLARAIVPALRKRMDAERARGTAIIYVNDWHREDDDDFAVWPKHAVRHTRGAEVIPALLPTPADHVVHRVSYSAFFETDLEPLLESLEVTDLTLTGQAADACVMMTAIDALMRGYRVEVPADSVAGLTPEGKVFALRRIAMLKPYQAKLRR